MSAILVLLVLPMLLALAAAWDLTSYTIPNWLPLSLLAAFVLFALVAGLPGATLGSHLAAGLVGLAAGFALFAGGYVGGGDAKLFATAALWFGFGDLPAFALSAAMLGGGLTLVILMVRSMPLPAGLITQRWIVRLHDARSGIPYGVALAAGALLTLPGADVFHLVSFP